MITKLFRAALLTLAMIPAALGAQATYTTPTTGPMSFGTFVSTYLNPALAAVLSNNSGATAPAVTGQPGTYQWWVDTSTTPRVLKIYDGTSWLSLATIDTTGHVLALTGTSLNLSGLTASSAVATDGSKNLVSVTNTGSGNNVLATSPTLVTPNLGTPATATLTNATGLPIATGVSGLGAGVATFLATPSSANLASAVTGETGSGAAVFATSPALVTPDLGTPSAGTLTNATGLPVATGISGLGTGVATFLATPSTANLAAAVTGETGTGAIVFATSPTLVTPDIGVATATSVNKVAITAPATSATLTIANGKTLTASNTITIAGTDSTVMTFPSTTATIARIDSGQTFTGVQVMTSPALTTPAITGLATGSGVSALATASTLVARDVNANIAANAFLAGYTTTATAAGTTTLTVASTELQYFTGSTTQTVALPVASTLVLGQSFTVVNNSSGAITVNSSGGNLVLSVAPGNTGTFTAVLTSGTTDASWSKTYIASGAGTGTVTSVTCGTGLTGGTFTTSGTCAISAPVSIANGGTGVTTGAFLKVVVQTFSTSGTYTPTTGMLYAKVEVIGGGGGGGGVDGIGASNYGVGGGGGAGGYASEVLSAATIGASQTVTIGAGGAAGANTGGSGGSGGTTSLGALLSATGGNGGVGRVSTTTINMALGGATGIGSGGDVNGGGTPGQPGLWATDPMSGAGGSLPPFGSGGNSVNPGGGNTTSGNAGAGNGSGGSGAASNTSATNAAGGAGTGGLIVITEFVNQ